MMKLNKFLIILAVMGLFFTACNNDDDAFDEIPVRDRGEQAIEDDEALIEFMSTHFYNYEEFENAGEDFDNIVRFDTISGSNSNKTPIIESDLLMTKIVTRDDVDYKLYILKVREGEGRQPTFADSTFQEYKGELLNLNGFDNAINPIWFDLPGYISGRNPNTGQFMRSGGVIQGFTQGIIEFKGSTSFVVNPDNTVKWNNDYGVGAIFMPSGLGYFNSPPQGSLIPPYNPLIFTVKLYSSVEADHDNDGIPSWMEDVDGDGDLFNDDTDENGFTNHSDPDDDGDGTPTREEIIINEDGTITFPDTNGDGTPDYLDPNVF